MFKSKVMALIKKHQEICFAMIEATPTRYTLLSEELLKLEEEIETVTGMKIDDINNQEVTFETH